jgi:hypothetical protein
MPARIALVGCLKQPENNKANRMEILYSLKAMKKSIAGRK